MAQSQTVKKADDMREEVKKAARRVRATLHSISAQVSSNTVADFATRPHRRKTVTLKSLFEFFALVGHEMVVSRPDLKETSLRSDEDLREFFLDLAETTGRSLTAISRDAGISNGVTVWANGSSGAQTLQLDPVLKVLNNEKISLRVRKIQPTKWAAKRATITGS